MSYKFANFWDVAISQAITAGATTIYVDSDDAALLPSLGVGDEIRCVLYTDEDTREIISITAVSGGTLTIERAKESTTAQAWPAGTRLVATVTGEQLQIVNSTAPHFIAASASAAGNDYTVTVVGTIPSLVDSEELSFTIPATNTGNPVRIKVTNGVDDTGWVTVLFLGGVAPEAGDLESGFKVTFRYFGSNYYVSTPASYQAVFRQMNQGPLGNPNMERNSRLEAWNTATSFSSPASLTEICDGWYVQHDGTIGTYTVSRQTFTLGQTSVPFNPQYFLRWDHSSAGSGSTLRSLRTKIPGVQTRSGEKIIRRVYAKADVARNVEAKIIQHFGTGGSPSADVEAATETWALTTSWQAFDIEATLPSISGKTLGSGGDDGIVLALNLPVNTTMTIDFAMPSTEPGKISTYHNGSLPLGPKYGGLGGSFDSVTNLLTLRALASVVNLSALANVTFAAGEYPLFSSSSALVAGKSSNRNYIINGCCRVWQLGAGPFTSASTFVNNDDTYLMDMCVYLADGADICDVSQETSIVPTGAYSAIKIDIETANKKWGLLFPVEARNAAGLIGGNAVASFKARKGSSNSTHRRLRAAIISWTGSADSITSDVVSSWGGAGTNPTLVSNWTYETTPQNLNLTNSYQKFDQTHGLSGAIDTASTKQFALFVWTDDVDATVGDLIYLTEFKIEEGTVATRFEYDTYRNVLEDCWRYFEPIIGSGDFTGDGTWIAQRAGSTLVIGCLKWRIRKRIAPSLVHTSPTWATAYPSGNEISAYEPLSVAYVTPTGAVSYSLAANGIDGAEFRATAATSFTETPGEVCAGYTGASCQFFADARL